MPRRPQRISRVCFFILIKPLVTQNILIFWNSTSRPWIELNQTTLNPCCFISLCALINYELIREQWKFNSSLSSIPGEIIWSLDVRINAFETLCNSGYSEHSQNTSLGLQHHNKTSSHLKAIHFIVFLHAERASTLMHDSATLNCCTKFRHMLHTNDHGHEWQLIGFQN